MPEHEVMERLAQQFSEALEAGDLAAFSDRLDPNVRWGAPGDPTPACQSREQVFTWYRRALDSGTRGWVAEVTVLDDRLLVRVKVMDTADGEVERWQVLTVRSGLVVDIVGFENRSDALGYRTVPTA